MRVRTAQNFPIRHRRFDDVHGNGFPPRDYARLFRMPLVKIVGDLTPVGLLALADNVKGVTHLDLDRFVLWRVIDAVFAHELQAAIVIGLVNAYNPLEALGIYGL